MEHIIFTRCSLVHLLLRQLKRSHQWKRYASIVLLYSFDHLPKKFISVYSGILSWECKNLIQMIEKTLHKQIRVPYISGKRMCISLAQIKVRES